MFRYYSCLFRVAEFKKSTARAVVLRSVPHCYTIEASTGFYYCPVEKKDIAFTPEKWAEMVVLSLSRAASSGRVCGSTSRC
jgi:hypothetical protein